MSNLAKNLNLVLFKNSFNYVYIYLFNSDIVVIKFILKIVILFSYKKAYELNFSFSKYKNIFLCENTNLIRLDLLAKQKYFIINNVIRLFIKTLFFFFIKKIKFSGKGYYLYKDNFNTLGAQFNYAHKINFYLKGVYIKKFTKRSWMFFNINKSVLDLETINFLLIRPVNIFTSKGIKFTKATLYLKQ